ncbi:MAG: SRPBCC family protein [Myxococcota bacterium]
MHISISEAIHAPIEAVFDAMTDPEGHAERIPAITRCEVLTDGPVGAGTRFRETRVMFGKEATEEMEFTEFDRPHGYLLEAHSHGMNYRTRHTLTREGDAIRVTLDFHGTLQNPVARVMGLLAASPGFSRDVERSAGRRPWIRRGADWRRALAAPRAAAPARRAGRAGERSDPEYLQYVEPAGGSTRRRRGRIPSCSRRMVRRPG